MDRFVKINSNQGGPFNVNQNLLDFHLSPGSVYNLKDSYISLNCDIQVVENETTSGVGIYPMDLKWVSTSTTSVPKVENVSLVRNATLSCQAKGQIENIRRVDMLKQNLYQYTKSQNEDISQSYLGANQLIDPVNRNQFSIYSDINKTGNIKSRSLTSVPIQIPLADMFEFCRATEFDTARAGMTHIHCELNMDKLQAVQRNLSANWANTSIPKVADLTVVGALNQVSTTVKYTNLDASPFYVGMKVVIASATPAGTTPPAVIVGNKHVINSIVWNKAAGGQLDITFATDIGTLVSGQSYTGVTIVNEVVASATFNINFAEIVVKEVTQPQGFDVIEYSTYSTEETNGGDLLSFQRQFTVEPEAVNLMIMFPSALDDIVSHNPGISSWRLRQNSKDLTDRPLEKSSPLAWDRKNMTLLNLNNGRELENLVQVTGNTSRVDLWKDVYSNPDVTVQTIMSPLTQTTVQKLLQVNITSTTPIKDMILFKQLTRKFQY
tara:strand:- start:11335 stop:12816 length:1482 start_codon:yes stop_codon:yes gene_type:complete